MEASRIDGARHALLALHKSIIESERGALEQRLGAKIASGDLLQRLVSDPHFAWLNMLTALIVRLDEALEPDATEGPDAVLAFAIDLLTPGPHEAVTEEGGDAREAGHPFKGGYARALQASADVVLAHRSAMLALRASR